MLQVHAHSASIDHAWQSLAFPWWQRWLFHHHAALSRRPPRKPAEATARNLQRLLLLEGQQPRSPRADGSGGGSSDGPRGGSAAEEGGLWSTGFRTGTLQMKSSRAGDASSVRFGRLMNLLSLALHGCINHS